MKTCAAKITITLPLKRVLAFHPAAIFFICFLSKQNWTTYLNIQAAKQATVDITVGLSSMPQWTTRWMMSWWNCQGHWQVAMWHYFWILLDFMRAPRWIGKKVPWSRFDKCGKKLWKGGILGRGRALVWNFQRIETFDIDFVIGCFWYFWKLEHVWCIDHDPVRSERSFSGFCIAISRKTHVPNVAISSIQLGSYS